MQDPLETGITPAAPRDEPDPAGRAVDEPHLSADELQSEIGDSETWDDASEDPES